MQIINIFQTFFGGAVYRCSLLSSSMKVLMSSTEQKKMILGSLSEQNATRPPTFLFLLYEETNCRRPLGRTKLTHRELRLFSRNGNVLVDH